MERTLLGGVCQPGARQKRGFESAGAVLKRIQPEPIVAKRKLREIPKTLRSALDLLDKSSLLRTAMGDAVIDHYLHTGRWEQFEYDRRITDWEIKRGFERS